MKMRSFSEVRNGVTHSNLLTCTRSSEGEVISTTSPSIARTPACCGTPGALQGAGRRVKAHHGLDTSPHLVGAI